MISPEITAEEACRWRAWLSGFSLRLMTTTMGKFDEDGNYIGSGFYPVDVWSEATGKPLKRTNG